LVRRGREPGLGRWSIPGGVVELGEPVKKAVQREVEEETGLLVEAADLVEVFERIIPDPQGQILYHYVVLDYLCRIKGGRLKASSDATDTAFCALTQLSDLNVSWKTQEVIAEAYKRHQNFFLI
jgi:8-oxo-dGTP diphosphatase